MATPLIIGAAIAGLLPLGALAGRSNKQIIETLNMFPKRNQQLSKITELWGKSNADADKEQSDIILDNFINLCLTVIHNNQSKNDENINIELLQSLNNTITTTFGNINKLQHIKTNLDILIDKYANYIFNQNKTEDIINILMTSAPIKVYEYVTKLLQLPFHVLVRLTTSSEAIISELMVEENLNVRGEMYKTIQKTYNIDNSYSLLTTVYYCIHKLGERDDNQSKIITLKNKVIELEKTHRDDLTKLAIDLYPYYFDIDRDKNTKLDNYLDIINIKINGLADMSTLEDLSSILDDNNTLHENDKIAYSKQFVRFIRFVKNDIEQQGKEKVKRLEIEQREKEGVKRRKKLVDNEDDELLLLMLIMEQEEEYEPFR